MLKELVATGAIGLSVVGCADGATATPTQDTSHTTGVVDIRHGESLQTGNAAWICAADAMKVTTADEVMELDVTKNGQRVPDGGILLTVDQGTNATITPDGKTDVFCEQTAGHPTAKQDVQRRMPPGLHYVEGEIYPLP